MDYETHKAIEDAQQTLADLSESLDLEGRKKRIAEIDEIISAPDFWNNPEGGQAIMQEKKRLESKVDKYNALAGKMEDLESVIDSPRKSQTPISSRISSTPWRRSPRSSTPLSWRRS